MATANLSIDFIFSQQKKTSTLIRQISIEINI